MVASEQNIRDAIDRHAIRRQRLYHAQAEHHDPAASQQIAALTQTINNLWDDLRHTRAVTSLFCIRCNKIIDRDDRVLHGAHEIATLAIPGAQSA